METAVLSDIYKTLLNRGEEPRIFFYRTSSGIEVDIILEYEQKLVPIEVKLSSTPSPSMAAGIKAFRASLGDRVAPGYVVHPGEVHLPLGEGVVSLPFSFL